MRDPISAARRVGAELGPQRDTFLVILALLVIAATGKKSGPTATQLLSASCSRAVRSFRRPLIYPTELQALVCFQEFSRRKPALQPHVWGGCASAPTAVGWFVDGTSLFAYKLNRLEAQGLSARTAPRWLLMIGRSVGMARAAFLALQRHGWS